MKSTDVIIRVLEKTDIPRTTGWMNDPEICDIMGYLPVFTVDQQLKWFESLANDRSRFVFAICLSESGEHIGNVGLGNIDYINRFAMVNIFLTQAAHRRRGLGSQAMKLILQFAFNRLNLNKVYLQTSRRFSGAIEFYEKLGFVKDGEMRQHCFHEGKWENKLIYSLLNAEYYSLHEPSPGSSGENI